MTRAKWIFFVAIPCVLLGSLGAAYWPQWGHSISFAAGLIVGVFMPRMDER